MSYYLKFSLIAILMCFTIVNGCQANSKSNPKKKIVNQRNIEDVIFNQTLINLIDSFILELQPYSYVKDHDSISPITYISIIESQQNKSFKIHFQSINSFSQINKLNVDDFFVKNHNYCLVNYNFSNLVRIKKTFSVREIIKKTKIERYHGADTRMPAWLVLITNDTIGRINKKANSIFVPISDKLGVFTKKGLVYYNIDEWGEITDESGTKVVIPSK